MKKCLYSFFIFFSIVPIERAMAGGHFGLSSVVPLGSEPNLSLRSHPSVNSSGDSIFQAGPNSSLGKTALQLVSIAVDGSATVPVTIATAPPGESLDFDQNSRRVMAKFPAAEPFETSDNLDSDSVISERTGTKVWVTFSTGAPSSQVIPVQVCGTSQSRQVVVSDSGHVFRAQIDLSLPNPNIPTVSAQFQVGTSWCVGNKTYVIEKLHRATGNMAINRNGDVAFEPLVHVFQVQQDGSISEGESVMVLVSHATSSSSPFEIIAEGGATLFASGSLGSAETFEATTSNPQINDLGDVVFIGDGDFGDHVLLYSPAPVSGSNRILCDMLYQIPDDANPLFAHLSSIGGRPTFNNAGQVAFFGTLGGSSFARSIFLFSLKSSSQDPCGIPSGLTGSPKYNLIPTASNVVASSSSTGRIRDFDGYISLKSVVTDLGNSAAPGFHSYDGLFFRADEIRPNQQSQVIGFFTADPSFGDSGELFATGDSISGGKITEFLSGRTSVAQNGRIAAFYVSTGATEGIFADLDCRIQGVCLDIAQTVYNPSLGNGYVDLVDRKPFSVVATFTDPTTGSLLPNLPLSAVHATVAGLSGLFHCSNGAQSCPIQTDQNGVAVFDFANFLVPRRLAEGAAVANIIANSSNGALTGSRAVFLHDVKPFFLGFAGITAPNDGLCQNTYASVSSSSDALKAFAISATNYFQAVYPVPAVDPQYVGLVSTKAFQGSLNKFCADPVLAPAAEDDIDNLAIAKDLSYLPDEQGNVVPINRYIGVGDPGNDSAQNHSYFDYLGYGHGNIGLSWQKVHSATVVMKDSAVSTVAHEIGHTICLRFDGKYGCSSSLDNSIGSGHDLQTQDVGGFVNSAGPWGAYGDIAQKKFSFMTSFIPNTLQTQQWIRKNTYEQALCYLSNCSSTSFSNRRHTDETTYSYVGALLVRITGGIPTIRQFINLQNSNADTSVPSGRFIFTQFSSNGTILNVGLARRSVEIDRLSGGSFSTQPRLQSQSVP